MTLSAMKKKWLIIFFAILMSGALFFGIRNAPVVPAWSASKGVLDLSKLNVSEISGELRGEWAFYWNQLISPGDSIRSLPTYPEFPSLWTNISKDGKRLPSTGYATYLLRIILPAKRPALALRVPDVYSSYALYLNDQIVSQNGIPGKTRDQSKPFWTTSIVSIPEGKDTFDLVLQVSNFWHAKGGTYKNVLLGNQEEMMLNQARNSALDLILTGCLFMGGLFFLGMFLFGKHEKSILYFSLFCIFYSYRMIGTDDYVLHKLLPNLNWFLTVRVEYLSLVLGVAFFILYVRHLYPREANIKMMQVMIWACWLYAAVILFAVPAFFTSLLSDFLVLMFAYTAYAFLIFIRAARNNRVGSDYAFLGTGVMMMLFLIINLHYFGIISELKVVVFTGYIVFFFLQSLILSYRFSNTLKQAARLAQQGLKIKSEFLSTMSHEIRTPLNVVIGMAHVLLRNQPREDQKESMNVLLFSANNLLSIVNDILDYNKIEAGKVNFEQINMDLSEIAGNIVAGQKGFAEEKGIVLQLLVDGNLRNRVVGDPTRLTQVLSNLVHNAIKFTMKGHVKISILVERIIEDSVMVRFNVEDSGIGISLEKQKIIFERFTQADSSTSRSFGGTGLGLAISKKILELQGVSLHVNSEPDKGSVFYFEQVFPLTAELSTTKAGPESNPSDEKSLKGISILLVEDNPFNVMVAQSILEECGAQIDVASNGLEALDKIDTSRHRLVLMDINMPMMDGYKTTERLRLNGETLPIIALTASTPQEIEQEAYEAGFTDIVVKPFNPEELCRVILQYTQSVA